MSRAIWTWRLLVALFVILAGLILLEIALLPSDPLGLVLAAGIGVFAVLALAYHRDVIALADRQRGETEALIRILQGLSRSTSPDAVVNGIADELRSASGADHCVVVRRRPGSAVLDATLVSGSPGVPPTTTTLPATLLDVGEGGADGRAPGPDGRAPGADGRVPGADSRAPGADGRAPGADRRAPGADGPAPGADVPSAVAARIVQEAASFFGLKNTRAAPLVTSKEVVGALILSRRSGEPWRAEALHLLAGAAREASAALERAYVHVATAAAATTDSLTGLPNRRFLDILEARVTGRRRDDAMGALMVDIDHFKRLNDRFGHAAGDAVLRSVADAIAATVRQGDFPIRYGGEEFLVVLRQADRGIAVAVAERLRRNVARTDLRALGIAGPVTVSVGIAVADRGDQGGGDLDQGGGDQRGGGDRDQAGGDRDQAAGERDQAAADLGDQGAADLGDQGDGGLRGLIARADAALYRAKAAGRDRAVIG